MTSIITTSISRAQKIAGIAFGLSILAFSGFFVLGVIDGDIPSATVVGALVSAAFADVGILASYRTGGRIRLIAFAIWAFLAVALLAGTLLSLSSGLTDADLLLTYGVTILSFPLGILAGPIAGHLILTGDAFPIAALWAIAIGAGCLQWFFVIPAILRLRVSEQHKQILPKL